MLEVAGKTDGQCAEVVIESIIALSNEVGIPSKLAELGVEDVDLEKLSVNSLKDACAPGPHSCLLKKKLSPCLREFYNLLK